ncbi:DUF6886 family protein [Umezawaea sp. Da 62-37]|uniref:DUF6886 family protein n=1 Tax=Umezawaea sp. Da 62-37 TaxID=3075927 RepID=UPI0028F71109|nr:DUF6886 family protein [Umezawaea sp. Da 62-37]WNV91291.1 hypothetical protein RM788_24370 [Umezawaea sp. Da 62-37]
MRPGPGQVLHFSEDPTITRFTPHVAPTARQRTPYVWAVDGPRCPDYWFPRDCPRAMAWTTPTTTTDDATRLLGPGEVRLHAVEHHWLEVLRTARLYAYRLPASAFTLFGDDAHAHVATEPVEPLGPVEPVGDLLALHEEAGIQLRLLTTLWPLWDAITTSTLGFSGIRLGNARPRA